MKDLAIATSALALANFQYPINGFLRQKNDDREPMQYTHREQLTGINDSI
jgi:hypothetical protein